MKHSICPDCGKQVSIENVATEKEKNAMERDAAPKYALCKTCNKRPSLVLVAGAKGRPLTSEERQGEWDN